MAAGSPPRRPHPDELGTVGPHASGDDPLTRWDLTVEPYPDLDLGVFVTVYPASLDELGTPGLVLDLLSSEAEAPLQSDDRVRAVVRDLLRPFGYKPTGRGKPASEYLARAAAESRLGPINLAVDLCNAVSLHSGLPISVVDLDRLEPPLRVGMPSENASYVFNPGGQVIRLAGLICLHDRAGPCANAIRDAQRSKTDGATRRTLSLVWGARSLDDRTARTVGWYRRLVGETGAMVEDVEL